MRVLEIKRDQTRQYYRAKVLFIKQIINSRLDEQLTGEKLADHACISYHHLRDIFLALEGTPVGTYVNRQRVTQAAYLLRTTDDTLDLVAAKVGYINKSSLSKAFKRLYHVSPGRFREEIGSPVARKFYQHKRHNNPAEICED